jgi:hypothetical protein
MRITQVLQNLRLHHIKGISIAQRVNRQSISDWLLGVDGQGFEECIWPYSNGGLCISH